MKLRLGFLGIGAMGLKHLRQFHVQHADRAEVVAICGRSEANLKRALEVVPNARVFSDEHELIHSDLDAVCVSTPNFTHVPLALETLKAGRHLFLEKPCGITRVECHLLMKAAERTDRVVMIGHEFRYAPFFQKVKSLVDTGEIGRPRMVWTREFRWPFQPKSQDWIQDQRRSGGLLVDKNCHHFDLMNWWVGARPVRVAAFGGSAVMRVVDAEHQVNDHATVSFDYDNGTVGTLQICLFAREFPHDDLEMGVVGEAGSLQIRPATREIVQWTRGAGQGTPIVHRVEPSAGEGSGNHPGFEEMHEAFLAAVLDGQQHLTPVGDCLDGTLLAIAAEESIAHGHMMEV